MCQEIEKGMNENETCFIVDTIFSDGASPNANGSCNRTERA